MKEFPNELDICEKNLMSSNCRRRIRASLFMLPMEPGKCGTRSKTAANSDHLFFKFANENP